MPKYGAGIYIHIFIYTVSDMALLFFLVVLDSLFFDIVEEYFPKKKWCP